MRSILAVLITIVLAAVIFFIFVTPRMNWSAAAEPGALEGWLADRAIGGWVSRNAPTQSNPMEANAANLKTGRGEFNEHCAACHGLDGGGANQLRGDFYPPIAKLTGDTQEMSDGTIDFIIANGIRYSAMPAFAPHLKPDDIWRMVLWVRHLGHLSPEEKAALQAEMRARSEQPDTSPR